MTYLRTPTLILLNTPTDDAMEDSAFNGTKHDTSSFSLQVQNVADTLEITFYCVFIGVYLTSKRRQKIKQSIAANRQQENVTKGQEKKMS